MLEFVPRTAVHLLLIQSCQCCLVGYRVNFDGKIPDAISLMSFNSVL